MRIKSKVLIGLVILICLVSGVSFVKRIADEKDLWRPSDVYSSLGVNRRSTFSSVTSVSGASSDVVTVSSGARSMPGRGIAFSYAPASASTHGQMPIAGTSSYSQSPIANSQRLHTTSSAEIRSFGGGGNGGGVSMSGGAVRSSGSSVASSAGLSVSMPSTSVLAVNNTRNNSSVNDVMSSVSGDIAMASSQAYAGIGNTTGGGSRGMSGKRDVPSIGSGVGNAYVNILTVICGGSPDYTLTDDELSLKWSVYYSLPGMAPVGWDEFLAWYKTVRTLPDSPIGDVFPLLFIALIFAMRILLKSRKTIKCKFEN